MRHVAVCFAFVVAWGLAGGPTARAQEEVGSTEEITVMSGDPRSAARDWLILPKGKPPCGWEPSSASPS
jgi:hypothetical protein